MSPHIVTGVETGCMFDSADEGVLDRLRGGSNVCELTFHHVFFNDLAELLHVELGEILALLCLL